MTLITTAAPYQPDSGDQGPGGPHNSAAKVYNLREDRAEAIAIVTGRIL